MRILALDTATELCSAALAVDGSLLTRESARPRGAAELILGMIEALLAEAGLTLRQLDLIAFGRGPGAFTGVRLALAVAQGLGFAADLPLLPISDLRALAQQALSPQPLAPPPKTRVLVCQDARMGQVYWGCFEWQQGARPVGSEAIAAPGAVQVPERWRAGAVTGAGSGFEAYAAQLALPGVEITPILGHLRPRAYEIAALALLDGMALAMPAERAAPVYLRDEVAALPSRN